MKVLQIIDGEEYGGIAKVMQEAGVVIHDVDFDYLTSIKMVKGWRDLGISRKSLTGKIKYNARLFRFLRKNDYDIVQVNTGIVLFAFQVVLVARLARAKKVVVHSHSTTKPKYLKKVIVGMVRPLLTKMSNALIACSSESAKATFGKTNKVVVIKNGINVKQYKFDKKTRERLRYELELDGNTVYGNVGMMVPVKNQSFLIDVFNEMIKSRGDLKLLLLGEGELREVLKEKVDRLGLKEKVMFLGFRKDADKIFSAMDVLVMPSLSEGMPLVAIEAQVNGLPIVAFGDLTDEVKILDSLRKVKGYNEKEWAKALLSVNMQREKNADKTVKKNGFDIESFVSALKRVYEALDE